MDQFLRELVSSYTCSKSFADDVSTLACALRVSASIFAVLLGLSQLDLYYGK